MQSKVLAIALTIASWSIAACTAHARSPEPLTLDRVECARCRMLVSSHAGSGQIVSGHDDARFYDDIGCLAADWNRRADTAAAFVFVGGDWSDARGASFARPSDARTAMGSGFVAFPTAAAARAADRDGRAFTWDDIVRLAGEGR